MCVFFFNDTATTEIYTLSLHDALPISEVRLTVFAPCGVERRLVLSRVDGLAAAYRRYNLAAGNGFSPGRRSEEHTSELQSRQYLVCRLLLEKKKKQNYSTSTSFHISIL